MGLTVERRGAIKALGVRGVDGVREKVALGEGGVVQADLNLRGVRETCRAEYHPQKHHIRGLPDAREYSQHAN